MSHQLRKGEAGARGDDAANLTPVIVSWIGALFEHASHIALIPTLKTDRGFEHELTGRLLCPVDYNWDDVTQVFLPFKHRRLES